MLILVFTLFLSIPNLLAQGPESKAVTADINSELLEWTSCPEFMPDHRTSWESSRTQRRYLFKLEGDTSVPNHWHHSAERNVLISGR